MTIAQLVVQVKEFITKVAKIVFTCVCVKDYQRIQLIPVGYTMCNFVDHKIHGIDTIRNLITRNTHFNDTQYTLFLNTIYTLMKHNIHFT